MYKYKHTYLLELAQHTPAYSSIRQHTSAYVSAHQRTSAYVSIREVQDPTLLHLLELLELVLFVLLGQSFLRCALLWRRSACWQSFRDCRRSACWQSFRDCRRSACWQSFRDCRRSARWQSFLLRRSACWQSYLLRQFFLRGAPFAARRRLRLLLQELKHVRGLSKPGFRCAAVG
jgi:hypothetical protein